MDRFKRVFRAKESAQSQHNTVRSRGTAQSSINGSPDSWGSEYESAAFASAGADAGEEADRSTEGFLCPVCMASFTDVESLQTHFSSAHAEGVVALPPKAREDTLNEELGLIKMQLTASEESRLLHLRELVEQQRQAEELKLEHAQTLASLAEERRRSLALQQEVDAAHAQSSLLEHKLSSSAETVTSLELQLRDEKAACRELNSRTARLEYQLVDADNNGRSLAATLALAQDAAAAAVKAQAETLGQLAESKHRADAIQLELDSARVETCRLREDACAEKCQAQGEIEDLRRACTTLEERLNAAQARLDAEERARETLHKLETGEEAVEDAVRHLQEENAQLRAKLEATVKQCSQEKDELRTVLKGKERDLKDSFDALLETHEQSMNSAAKRLFEVEQRHTAEAAQYASELATVKSREAILQLELTEAASKLRTEMEKVKALARDFDAVQVKHAQREQQLSEQVQSAESESLSLRCQADSLKDKLNATEALFSEGQSQMESLKSTLVAEHAKVEHLEIELSSSLSTMADVKTQSSSLTDNLQQKLTVAELSLAECKAELSATQQKFLGSNAEIAHLEAEIKGQQLVHEEELAALHTLLAKSKRELEAIKQELHEEQEKSQQEMRTCKELLEQTEQAAAASAAELRILCSEQEQMCGHLRHNLESSLSHQNALEQELKSTRAALVSCQSELEGVTKEKAFLASSCADLSMTVNEATEKSKELNEQIWRMTADNSQLKAALDQKTQENEELERSHKAAMEQLVEEAALARLSALTEQAESLQAKFDELLNEHDEASRERLQHECAEAERAKQRELAALAELLRLERARAEEAEVRSNMQLVSLDENLSTVKTDLTATQEKLMDVVKHNDQLRGTLLELEAKLENSKEDRRVLLQRCLDCEHENTRLKEELSSCRRRFDEKEAALQELSRENQMLQIKTVRAQSRKWTDDSEAPECSNCAKAFSVTNRRHHCRNCGNIFCNECSSQSAATPSSRKPVRVCDACYRDLDGRASGAIM